MKKKSKILSLVILMIVLVSILLTQSNYVRRLLNWETEKIIEVKIKPSFAKTIWDKKVGLGYSTVSVYKNKLLTAGYSKEYRKDVLFCFNAKTGRLIWKYSYPATKGGGYAGVRATPVTNGKYVYQLSRDGLLICLTLDKGRLVWQKDTVKQFGAKTPYWGFASSPVFMGNKVVVNAGEFGMAFDTVTGQSIWPNKGGAGNYSSVKPFQ